MYSPSRTAWAVLAASVYLCAAASADAATTIGFDDATPQDGTLNYSGSGVLTGNGIDFDLIIGNNTPNFPTGVLSCNGCELNFTTGTNISEGSLPSSYQWSGGGNFTLTGATGGPLNLGPTTLLSGSFLSPVTVSTIGGIYALTGIVQPATIAAALASHYGVQAAGSAVLVEIAFGATPNPVTGAFTANVTNADVDFTPVPIPAALPLFLTALAGAGLIARRRQAA